MRMKNKLGWFVAVILLGFFSAQWLGAHSGSSSPLKGWTVKQLENSEPNQVQQIEKAN